MIAGQLAPGELIAAIQASVVVPPKERSVAKWWRKVVEHSAVDRNDGLKNKL